MHVAFVGRNTTSHRRVAPFWALTTQREGDRLSYNVNIWGHKDLETEDELIAFEQDVIAKVKEFAASLPGMGGGYVNTHSQPQEVLPASDGAATNPDGSPAEDDTADEKDK